MFAVQMNTEPQQKTKEEGISPKELCDRYHAIHSGIYKWFNIAFDKFGRTSTPIQTEVTQEIFLKLDKAGFICEKTIEQFYCSKCQRFLRTDISEASVPSAEALKRGETNAKLAVNY